jgi:uncharacterized caspase-like protein
MISTDWHILAQDVDDMSYKLTKLGYSCTVLKDPTTTMWKSHFRRFVADLQGCQIAVFHFSGHGGFDCEACHHHLSLGGSAIIDYEKDVMAYLTKRAPSMAHVHFLDCCRCELTAWAAVFKSCTLNNLVRSQQVTHLTCPNTNLARCI